jgi:dienelactone hydrolase
MGRPNEEAWFVPAGMDQEGKPVLLPTRVFVPSGQGPFPLAIISHGSPANPERRTNMKPPEYLSGTRWLLARGYMVVLPLRRGYGSHGKAWSEAYGKCEMPDYIKAGLATADDIEATVRYFSSLPNVRKDHILLVGQSAGGWGSIAAASRNPPGVVGVINFAGGRGGYADGEPNRNCAKDKLIEAAAYFGRTARIPSLWIYTENDKFFDADLSRRLSEAYRRAGSKAEYHLLPSFGDDGHRLFTERDGRQLWQPIADRFLDQMRTK